MTNGRLAWQARHTDLLHDQSTTHLLGTFTELLCDFRQAFPCTIWNEHTVYIQCKLTEWQKLLTWNTVHMILEHRYCGSNLPWTSHGSLLTTQNYFTCIIMVDAIHLGRCSKHSHINLICLECSIFWRPLVAQSSKLICSLTYSDLVLFCFPDNLWHCTFNFPSGHCDNSFLCTELPHWWCCHGKEG